MRERVKVLNCIICDKELESSMPNVPEAENQPRKAVVFQAYGNYGSEVFDPGIGAFLEINICDACIKKHKDQVLLGKSRKVESEYIYWDGIYG